MEHRGTLSSGAYITRLLTMLYYRAAVWHPGGRLLVRCDVAPMFGFTVFGWFIFREQNVRPVVSRDLVLSPGAAPRLECKLQVISQRSPSSTRCL